MARTGVLHFTRFLAAWALTLAFTQSAEAATLTLAWDAVPESQVVGYKLSYGTSPGTYTTTPTLGLQTSHAVSGLADGTTYYFAVQSFDGSGSTSPLSQELSATTASSPDTTPDPFSFVAQTNVLRSTMVTSNHITVAGIN